MVLFNKSFKKVSFLLTFFSFFPLYSQTSELTFNSFSKFGLNIGLENIHTKNERNSISFNYYNPKAFSIGVDYNILQKNNFNFKIGLTYRIYSTKDEFTIKAEDYNNQFNLKSTSKFGDFSQFKIPISIEYFKRLSNNSSLFFGIGPEILIYQDDISSGEFKIYNSNINSNIGYVENGKSTNILSIGLNLNFGLNIKSKSILLRPIITYHYQPSTIYINTVETKNLVVSENTISKHEILGTYLMFGFSVHTNRNLFRKKLNKTY